MEKSAQVFQTVPYFLGSAVTVRVRIIETPRNRLGAVQKLVNL